jgi:hypothetical protein
MYVKPGSDTYLTLCFRYEFVYYKYFKTKEEEINTALKIVLILIDQVNDLSKSAK